MGKGDGSCADRPAMTLGAPPAAYSVENPHPPFIDPEQDFVRYVDLVALDKLLNMREYRREPGAEHAIHDHAWWEAHKRDIAERGMREAVIIEYDPDTGMGYVSEGCHRLGVAAELGLDAAPARVVCGRIRAHAGTPRVAALCRLTEPGVLVDDFDNVPQYLRPAALGLCDADLRDGDPYLDPALAQKPGGRGLWVAR